MPADPKQPAKLFGGVLQVGDRVLERIAVDVVKRQEAATADLAAVRAQEAAYDAAAARDGGAVARFATLGSMAPAPAAADGGLLTSMRTDHWTPPAAVAADASAMPAGYPTPHANPGGGGQKFRGGAVPSPLTGAPMARGTERRDAEGNSWTEAKS